MKLGKLTRKTQQGFTLLEAIVAITIMTAVGMAIFTWISTLVVNTNRIEKIHQRNKVLQSASSYINSINVMQQPQGAVDFGNYQLQWQSSLIQQPTAARRVSGAGAEYKLGLYNVSAKISEQKKTIGSFDVRVVGFEVDKSKINPFEGFN